MSCTPEQEKIEHLQTLVNEYGETIQEQVQQLDDYKRTIDLLRQEGFATGHDDSDLVLSVVRQWIHNEKNHLGI